MKYNMRTHDVLIHNLNYCIENLYETSCTVTLVKGEFNVLEYSIAFLLQASALDSL